MLLERRTAPRYKVDDPAPITLDAVVAGTVVNVSETGLAIATPYKPVLNSVVRISIHLPDNEMPCDTRTQVIRSASSGQIGLKLLKADSFREHFERWRRFTVEQVDGGGSARLEGQGAVAAAGEAALPQADTPDDALPRPVLDLDALRAAILRDPEPSGVPFSSRTGIVAAVIACALVAGSVWMWYGRAHQDVKVQASDSLSAEPAPAAVSAPENVTRGTSDQIPGALSADAPAVPTRLEIRPTHESVKSAVAQKRTEHHGAPHEQIVVSLNRFAHVNPKLLHHPDRIYFDLSPGIQPKLPQTADLRSESRLVQRIRMGHGKDGMTRVVLELRRPCQYLAKVSSTPPYRLIINVRAGRLRGAM